VPEAASELKNHALIAFRRNFDEAQEIATYAFFANNLFCI